MSDPDPQPRPPRRRINGVTWVYQPEYLAFQSGRLRGRYGVLGFAMGCVKDDDGQLGPVD